MSPCPEFAAEKQCDRKAEQGVEPAKDRILFFGNLCLDHILEVEHYPKEDTGLRGLGKRKTLGGNGANSTRVLAQLRGGRSCVSWLGPVPRADEPDTAFALQELKKAGVETSLLEEVGGESLPSTFILSSRQNGSRTTISTRSGVREMSPAHFAAALERAFGAAPELGQVRWCHVECRLPADDMAQMMQSWHQEAQKRSCSAVLSLEVEKQSIKPETILPLLQLCDVAFFSREFLEAHESFILAEEASDGGASPTKRSRTDGEAEDFDDHVALRSLRALRRLAGEDKVRKGLWICGWGCTGAFALDTSSGQGFFEPAHLQPKVVDSVGAGDTFIASSIHAMLMGADANGTLECACAVAGRKVGQLGFADLHLALPAAMV